VTTTSFLALQQSVSNPRLDTSVIIFIVEVLLMLIVGRLLGELLRRLGQPEVLGQLIAGIMLGPTVFGNLLPAAYHVVFPGTPEVKNMIDAISQLGILMLLLLAGTESDFKIVQRQKRAAFFSSLSGIILPFACGLLLGKILPDSLLPAPEKRMITSLFLATALSISSIKIVAMVIMEVDFMRRKIGQLILASAIIDDTVGWIVVAVISGIAASGTIKLTAVGFTILGTLLFLGLSFTFGRTVITHIIRWTNDTLQIEFSVLSAILALMCLLAIITDLIGVHTVLGAFVTGILVGQSPILTDHIRNQLRGLVLGLFAPVFFAVAGLSVNLTILQSASRMELAIGLILIASVGKLAGCFVGGKLGGLTTREGIALAVGMNARGTTEVIVATIGLSIGVLSQDFYTLIVLMAVTTTMAMPPTLRWALHRIPLSNEEKERLEREEAEAKEFIPQVERLLVVADESKAGQLAALLSGLFIGTRQILATVLEIDRSRRTTNPLLNPKIADRVKLTIATAAEAKMKRKRKNPEDEDDSPPPAQLNATTSSEEPSIAMSKELAHGYDMIFVGLANALAIDNRSSGPLKSSVEPIIRSFEGTLAVAVATENSDLELDDKLEILVPVTGTDYSRQATEVAVAIARGCNGRVTALNISPPLRESLNYNRQQEHLRPGKQLLKDVKMLGQREGVAVRTLVQVRRAPEPAIIRRVRKGKHNLLVVGANLRPGEDLFLGHSVRILLEKVPCSAVVVVS
jgi:Kef-type K+ transport system membrane component KefB/nucleotide-binding universal stress UspA family protein